jgi:hypothetical protein
MRLLLLLLSMPILTYGQCYNRYAQEIFPSAQVTTNIPYGESINSDGDTITLLLDYYKPIGDPISKRPLLILMHGPDLVNSSKEDSILVAFTQKMVKRGYAVATINYRTAFSLQTLLYKKDLFKATLQAAQDAKAAVRFFRGALQATNSYNVDSTMIWLGGIGAGSMGAQMAVYLDDTLEVSPEWQTIINTEGGLEGNSGNAQYSSIVRGVINLSGAILDTAWMANNSEPLINLHGNLDDYYPYLSDSLFAYTHNTVCNGHHELCYKRINEVTFVQTHNSHANDNDFSVLAANQNGDIPAQFTAGVRALGIKLYYESSFFCPGNSTQLYAYHGNPLLGCLKFSDIGAQVLTFLNNSPNEFLFITVEGSASNSEIATGFNSAGLTPFLYQHTLGEQWPTIGELIASGQRLIVMTNNSGTALPGYHHMWSFVQDTEYDYQSANDFVCTYLRGNANADLFLLNHFLTIASPQPLSATATNAWDLLLNRARQCGADRGLHPNLLYIDFFNSGDVFRAADTLNRIGEDFPLVHGSFTSNNYAQQQGIISELYTMNGQGFAPYNTSWGDSAAAFISDFMIRHFPCEMSCATPVDQIIGQDSIWKDSTYSYAINNNLGASYQWITVDSTYNNTASINISSDSSGFITIELIETSQYGCVYDTISVTVAIFTNTAIQIIEDRHNFWIHPNPSREKLWIQINNNHLEPYIILVYDNQGRLVINKKQDINGSAELNIEDLAEGVYLLKIIGKQKYIAKFVKLN